MVRSRPTSALMTLAGSREGAMFPGRDRSKLPVNHRKQVTIACVDFRYFGRAEAVVDEQLRGTEGSAALKLQLQALINSALADIPALPLGKKDLGDGALVAFDTSAASVRFAEALFLHTQ